MRWMTVAGLGLAALAIGACQGGDGSGSDAPAAGGDSPNGAGGEGLGGGRGGNSGGSLSSGGSATGGAEDADAGATGGTDVASGGAGGSPPWNGVCPDQGGPTMVKVPDGFCIDSTEVTRAQYQAWLDTDPDPASAWQHELCGDNTSFERDAECIGYDPDCQDECDDFPVTCIDWCDAQAYCNSVGKRLCGHVDGGGVRGPDLGEPNQREPLQWYIACSNGSPRSTSQYCNYGTTEADAVASHPDCQTTAAGYEGIYDLTTNVWEYVDECDTESGGVVRCQAKGGSYDSYYASCINDLTTGISNPTVHKGFRCCAP